MTPGPVFDPPPGSLGRRTLLAGAMGLGAPARAATDAPPQAGMTPTFDYWPARDGVSLLRGGPRRDGYGGPGTWIPRYSTETGPKGSGNRWNGEHAFYLDPEYPWSNRHSPFALVDGCLRIRAERAAPLGFRPREIPDDPQTGAPYDWVTGALTSRQRFSQQGGYFELDARLPKGAATWPAFWLLPNDEAHPPEIDVVEYLGHEPTRYRGTLLSPGPTGKQVEEQSVFETGMDLGAGFHRYGLLWTDTEIAFFFDGTRLASKSIAGRPEYFQPFYLILNVAIGSDKPNWVPPPSADTPGTADMLVRRVRAWQRTGPRQVVLSRAAVTEGAPAGTTVADLSCIGADGPVRFTLPDDGGGRFALAGNRLRTTGPLRFVEAPTRTVTVAATDARGRGWRQPVSLAVLDAGKAPNLLRGRGGLRDPAWSRFGVRVVNAGNGTELVLEQPGEEPHAVEQATRRTGRRFIVSADLKPRGRDWIKLEVADGGGPNVQVFFDLASGRIGDRFASPDPVPLRLHDCRCIPLEAGFYRCQADVGMNGGEELRVSLKLVLGGSDYGTHRGDPAAGVLSRSFIRAVAVPG